MVPKPFNFDKSLERGGSHMDHNYLTILSTDELRDTCITIENEANDAVGSEEHAYDNSDVCANTAENMYEPMN